MNWRMPSETDPQERVWTAFPPSSSYIGEGADSVDAARRVWAEVAGAIVRFEPVTMLVDPADLAIARRLVPAAVELVETPLDDAWLRDTGPSFVLDEAGRLGAVDWVFNGWGQQDWATWEKDAEIGRAVTGLAGAAPVPSPLVNEGGGIHVDGLGTALVTETVQLDPYRNPGLTKADVEAELARTIGVEHVVWLPRGLTRDSRRLGTRGHVDLLATIPSPGRLLVHTQPDPSHPDHEITEKILAVLRDSKDVNGTAWQITELPAPTVLRDAHDWVDYSYINHLVVNGAVIACGFADPRDKEAAEILAEAYPGREVVMLDARAIFAAGGGIHCITQQQPCAEPQSGPTDQAGEDVPA
ncbi:agmatine deiminase family protein [Streptomyces triticagri]|uniref:Agmatine deiminase family protein n=1 Tax=Streptomyces triticagri TaxID=2293568 RepID=A0A372M576_9ACTN|nr:agmatine deiminase family protein [Streptomyces triticagri]RFU86084.1 agmatine deiminase family protein [Streptomyces triticagri]